MALISTGRSVLPLINARARRSFLSLFSEDGSAAYFLQQWSDLLWFREESEPGENSGYFFQSECTHLLARGERTAKLHSPSSSVDKMNLCPPQIEGKGEKNNSPLIGNVVEESWWSRRTREGRCFFSSKCFHSLNKFNKTGFDWQRGALPQCLLFALAFLVSSCALVLNETKGRKCARTHTHTLFIRVKQAGLLPKSRRIFSSAAFQVLFCAIESKRRQLRRSLATPCKKKVNNSPRLLTPENF